MVASKIVGQVTRTWTGTNSADPVTDVRNTYDDLDRLETVSTYAREGAALLAARLAGRSFLGCELSPEYHRIAAERLKQSYSEMENGGLFKRFE